MKTLYEIGKTILPAIMSGIFTFLVTKYTYNKNRPLDKLEIAYNRFYYPLYKIICNKEICNDIDLIINKTKTYLDKYDKYVDKSTFRAYKYLCECNTNTKKKSAYQNFKNNIHNRNTYLRRKLGYLEPNLLQIYTYSSQSEKFTFRILIECCVLCVIIYIGGMLNDLYKNLFKVMENYIILLILLLLLVILAEIICRFIMFLYYKIRK